MKRAINTNIRREFHSTKRRFFSIITLIFLGVFVFIGLKVSGNDIRMTALNYYEKINLADSFVISNIGISDEDINIIKEDKNIESYELSYMIDLVIKNSGDSIRIMSIPKKISKIDLIKGTYPVASDEILIDNRLVNDYKLGDRIILTDNLGEKTSKLKNNDYKIVGFVNSGEYIDSFNLGNSNTGNGKLKSIAYVKENEFDMPVYSIAKIKYQRNNNRFDYEFSDEYKNNIEKNNDALRYNLLKNKVNKLQEFKRKSYKKIDDEDKNIERERAEFVHKKNEITLLENKLKNLESEFNSKDLNSDIEVNSYIEKIKIIRDKITEYKSFVDNNEILNNLKYHHTKKYIKDSKKELEHINELSYNVMSRDEYIINYSMYRDGSYKLDTLSNLFPVFFFAVALLVTLSTMLRMVDEQRAYMGILKSMGYSEISIIKKYIYYGLLSSLIGCIFGVAFGMKILPDIIFISYSHNFIFTQLITDFNYIYAMEAIILSLFCTTLAAIFVAKKELKNKPIQLLTKKVPKSGSRIVLEKIKFIWNRMSFNNKVTARNIFRYKIRMMMTILGVSGCTALLIIGIGIKDSISSISDIQFKEISKYDIVAVYDKNMPSDKIDEYKLRIIDFEEIDDIMPIHSERLKLKSSDKSIEYVNIFAPSDKNKFRDFIELRNRKTKKNIKLEDDKAIITEKLYQDLIKNKNQNNKKVHSHNYDNNINYNDNLILKDDNNKIINIKYEDNTEWYTGHNVFISKKNYEKTFKKRFDENAFLIKLKEPNDKNINLISKKIVKLPASKYIMTSIDNSSMIDSALDGLNFVVIVMIISSLLLAYVVLFNLTNINITERMTELSTIKVLGFYPKEVSMYIFKETIILTCIGILVGIILGAEMHQYIIQNLSPNDTMFIQGISIKNIVLSSILTLIFAIIVMRTMHSVINNVDMLDSLKSDN